MTTQTQAQGAAESADERIAAALTSQAPLSSVPIKVTLDSGNFAVYLVQPQHLPRQDVPDSARWPREYGAQLAHEKDGQWYLPGGWKPVEDARACDLLDAVEQADSPMVFDRASARRRARL